MVGLDTREKDALIGHDVVVGSMAEAELSECGMWVSDTRGCSIRRHILDVSRELRINVVVGMAIQVITQCLFQ